MEVFEGLKNSELVSKSVLSLPIEPLMEEREINIIVETIKQMEEN